MNYQFYLLAAIISFSAMGFRGRCAVVNDAACNILSDSKSVTINVHGPTTHVLGLKLLTSNPNMTHAALKAFASGLNISAPGSHGKPGQVLTTSIDENAATKTLIINVGSENFFVMPITLETKNGNSLREHANETLKWNVSDDEIEVLAVQRSNLNRGNL